VKIIAGTLVRHQPRAIFFPHELDWNGTHVGTHFLVMDALRTLPADFQSLIVETEYWEPMSSPNLMVELGVDDVADLVSVLSFHIGEVSRNPYHLRLPAWLLDNVRRGAEVAGGQGGPGPVPVFGRPVRPPQEGKAGQPQDEARQGPHLVGTEGPLEGLPLGGHPGQEGALGNEIEEPAPQEPAGEGEEAPGQGQQGHAEGHPPPGPGVPGPERGQQHERQAQHEPQGDVHEGGMLPGEEFQEVAHAQKVRVRLKPRAHWPEERGPPP